MVDEAEEARRRRWQRKEQRGEVLDEKHVIIPLRQHHLPLNKDVVKGNGI